MRGANGVVGILRTSVLARILLTRHSCSKLFVAGLSWDTNEPVLKEAFGKHGEIIEVKVICDHVSGKSRGYGFVKFTSESEATMALKEMDGQVVFSIMINFFVICMCRKLEITLLATLLGTQSNIIAPCTVDWRGHAVSMRGHDLNPDGR
ncbi:hypothetical protein DVH24_038699 [Malus domestica]|uniref:RRM domain-containing protein n=1 Tax=Malus domestica TaxID=3750 RepID=A0A498KFA5_MALDO|nr:hypothetical protein DVH24_038699 [Malus domestica]